MICYKTLRELEQYNLKEERQLYEQVLHVLNNEMNSLSKTCPAYSFSEVSPHKYNLLWSHYAMGGRGLCFEYDPTVFDKHREVFHPVIYKAEIPYFYIDGEQRIDKLTFQSFLTKLDIWKYEKEWRYIDSNIIIYLNKEERQNSEKSVVGHRQIHHTEQKIKTEIKPSKIWYIEGVLYCEDKELLEKFDFPKEGMKIF